MADTATMLAAPAGAAESDDLARRPVVTLLPGGHRRAEAGHPWIFSNEIAMDAAAKALAPGTLADDLQWREIDGAGSVYTFTEARRPTGPPWADAVPQILAVVQWDAGPRFSTELVDVDPSDVRVGMRVSPVFCDIPGTGVTLLRYRPEPADV